MVEAKEIYLIAVTCNRYKEVNNIGVLNLDH